MSLTLPASKWAARLAAVPDERLRAAGLPEGSEVVRWLISVLSLKGGRVGGVA